MRNRKRIRHATYDNVYYEKNVELRPGLGGVYNGSMVI